MTIKNPHLYEKDSTFVIRDASSFKRFIDLIGAVEGKTPILKQKDILDCTVLISAGFRDNGTAVFKMIVGEAWRHDLIYTHITQETHPLNIGLEACKAHRMGRTNLARSALAPSL